MSSRTIAEPMKPVAPVTKIRMPFSYAVANSVDSFEAFIRLASHAETLAVNRRHSQAEEGRWSIDSNCRSHSSADNFASSDPNNLSLHQKMPPTLALPGSSSQRNPDLSA